MVSFVGVGCGDDNNPVQQDAGQHDVNQQDVPVQDDVIPAQTDAQKDTGPLYTGTVGIYDVELEGLAPYGKGVGISITFEDSYAAKAPTLEEQPGEQTGCKLWEYVPSEYAARDGTDEGSVQLTFTQTDMDAGTPGMVVPPCVYVPGAGYTCAWGMGVGGTWSPSGVAQTKLFTVTNAGAAITALAVGSYLIVTDPPSGTGVVKGMFPIMAVPADNSLVVYVGAATVPDIAETGAWSVVFGKLPSPAFPNGMVSDDQTVKVKLTAGGGNHMAAFEETVTPNVGDHFTLKAVDATTTPKTVTTTTIPFDGTAFKIECDQCNSSLGSILTIETTDADLTGAGPTDFPAGAHKTYIRCSYFGVGSVTVPAEYSAHLTSATKAKVYFMRLVPKLTETLSIVAGHAVVGFATKP